MPRVRRLNIGAEPTSSNPCAVRCFRFGVIEVITLLLYREAGMTSPFA